MIPPEDLAPLGREDLPALVVELQRQIVELAASIEVLRAEIEQYRRSRQWPRQKHGSGPFRYRVLPVGPPVDVPVRSLFKVFEISLRISICSSSYLNRSRA